MFLLFFMFYCCHVFAHVSTVLHALANCPSKNLGPRPLAGHWETVLVDCLTGHQQALRVYVWPAQSCHCCSCVDCASFHKVWGQCPVRAHSAIPPAPLPSQEQELQLQQICTTFFKQSLNNTRFRHPSLKQRNQIWKKFLKKNTWSVPRCRRF